MINTKMNNGAILPRTLDGIVQLLGVKVSVTMLVIMSKKCDDSLQICCPHTSMAKILADVKN